MTAPANEKSTDILSIFSYSAVPDQGDALLEKKEEWTIYCQPMIYQLYRSMGARTRTSCFKFFLYFLLRLLYAFQIQLVGGACFDPAAKNTTV